MNKIILNNNLDPESLRREYSISKRIRIRNALRQDVAEELHRCLSTNVPWKLAYMDGDKAVTLDANDVDKLTDNDKAAIQGKILRQASDGFQFMYGHYSLFKAYKAGTVPCEILTEFVGYLDSQDYVEFGRKVTGNQEINRVDVQAARYAHGHFLSQHDDFQDPARRIAFVFNLSMDWVADWGGLTLFYDKKGNVIDSYSPMFNTLTMFQVPVKHSVTYISPFAKTTRFSITGWLLV
jgi:Rps23 Pro-64 3,4-dihydroxylase Tpa1-like proline 4-hydroxylase